MGAIAGTIWIADAPVPTLPEWLQTFVHPEDRDDVQRRVAHGQRAAAAQRVQQVKGLRARGLLRVAANVDLDHQIEAAG